MNSLWRFPPRPTTGKIGAALLMALLALGMAAPVPALANTLTVTSNADTAPVHDGVCTLREAITDANLTSGSPTYTECGSADMGNADTITFAAPMTITLTGALPNISANMNITGSGNTLIQADGCDPTMTVPVCTQTWRVFTVSGFASLNLDHLVIEHGSPAGDGGAINVGNNAVLSLHNSILARNKTAGKGGAIYVANGGTLAAVDNSELILNVAATDGGGLYTAAGSSPGDISNSSFLGNTANAGNGGGFYNAGTMSGFLTNATFLINVANTGGAIYNTGIFSGIDHSTIVGNIATTTNGVATTSAIGSISNTIIANNSGVNCSGPTPIAWSGVLTNSIGCFGWTENTLVLGTDTAGGTADNGCVTPLPDGSCIATIALPPGSIALNAATGCAMTGTDARGFSTPSGPACDVGAYESMGLTAGTACSGGNLNVVIVKGDGQFNITGSGPGLPVSGVSIGTASITTTFPGVWAGVTVAETGGDHETINLGGKSCGLGSQLPPRLKSPKNGRTALTHTPKLTWQKGRKGTTAYHVQIDNNSDFSSPTQADLDVIKPLDVAGFLDFGIYSWRVSSKNATGWSAYSAPSTFEVTLNKAPKDNGKPLKNGAVRFSWQMVRGATYLIQVYTDDTNETTRNASALFTQPAARPRYKIDRSAALTTGAYYWRVSVDNGATWTRGWVFHVQ